MAQLLVTILLFLCLLGCQNTAHDIASRKGESLASTPTENVAWAYGSAVGSVLIDEKPLRAELERRNAFTPEQWDRIDRKKIVIGDPVEVVYAAWGSPSRISNWTTEYSGGQEFEYYHVDRSNFVYIRDGRVAAVDN